MPDDEENDWYLSTLRPTIEHLAKEVESYDEIDDETEESILESGVDVFLDELARQHDVAVHEERSNRDRMRASIGQSWGHALDFLDFFVLVNQHARRHFETMADSNEKGENYQFDALMRLHVRALRVSREVVSLLRAGFANGAIARWRTLHEIAAVANIIAEEGEEAGERFLKFKTAKDLFRIRTNYHEYLDGLGFNDIEEETVEQLKQETEQLTDEFGEDFDNVNGWAAKFVDSDGRLTVTDLIKEGGLENYLPFYALACDAIHAGSKGTLFNIGLHEADLGGEDEILLAGRSDVGFTDPAQLTAIMLYETTEALRVLEDDETWQAYWEVYFRSMDRIVSEIADVFWLVDQLLSAGREAEGRPRLS